MSLENPEPSAENEIQQACVSINAEAIRLVAETVLEHRDTEEVRDRRGRVIQKGVDLIGRPFPDQRVTFELYNEREPNLPVVEYVSVWPNSESPSGYTAVETHIFQNGLTGQRGGDAESLEGEVRWWGQMGYGYNKDLSEFYLGFIREVVAQIEDL